MRIVQLVKKDTRGGIICGFLRVLYSKEAYKR